MLMMPYRNHSAAQRFADRRRRENAAPKLCNQVPGLTSLRLDVHEQVGVGAIDYIRRFVVAHTPALFLVPCGDPRCDGGHDLTTTILGALRAHEVSFRGTDACAGSVGPTSCPRVLSFDATAEYARSLGESTSGLRGDLAHRPPPGAT